MLENYFIELVVVFIFTRVEIDETISNAAHVAAEEKKRKRETIVARLSSAKYRIKEIMNFTITQMGNGKKKGLTET